MSTMQIQKQTFSFTDHAAQRVELVGDFTQWQQRPISMRKKSGGLWSASVNLEPGRHHYRFMVDGQWRDDPECEMFVSNPYGGQDAVREVS